MLWESKQNQERIKKMKILLLEDDLELCSLLQSQLTKNGYMVDACNDDGNQQTESEQAE